MKMKMKMDVLTRSDEDPCAAPGAVSSSHATRPLFRRGGAVCIECEMIKCIVCVGRNTNMKRSDRGRKRTRRARNPP
ncbi:hypothetical protein EYF80_060648 [Liparis tanakae]|uniref:Uncharacterized protein n=1 Tax=Liparis tanakae TaxID=230148 RepID=A0A4Z2EK16_9TELE|nr:hypothetical protein EYF80_060648 [Liparis tanakae]